MKTKLYAKELLGRLVSDKELKILEIVWDDEANDEEKIRRLMEEEEVV